MPEVLGKAFFYALDEPQLWCIKMTHQRNPRTDAGNGIPPETRFSSSDAQSNETPATTVARWAELYGDGLRGECAYRGIRGNDADDVLQEVFVEALSQLSRGNVVEFPRTWLSNVLYSKCCAFWNKQAANERLIDRLREDAIDPVDAEKDRERVEQLRELMGLLSVEDSSVIRTRLHAGSWDEVAAVLRIPRSKARRRHALAMVRLQRLAQARNC